MNLFPISYATVCRATIHRCRGQDFRADYDTSVFDFTRGGADYFSRLSFRGFYFADFDTGTSRWGSIDRRVRENKWPDFSLFPPECPADDT